jgi:hypothetical protein
MRIGKTHHLGSRISIAVISIPGSATPSAAVVNVLDADDVVFAEVGMDK